MRGKNTSRGKIVKPVKKGTGKKLDSLKAFASELGRAEAARRLGVSVSTITRWGREGVPESRFDTARKTINRRLSQLRRHEVRRTRQAREAVQLIGTEAELREAFGAKKRRKKGPELPASVAGDIATRDYLRVILPTLRDDILEANDREDDRTVSKLMKRIRVLRVNYQAVHRRILMAGPYPELVDATEDTIEAIARILAEREGKSVRFFYKMWKS